MIRSNTKELSKLAKGKGNHGPELVNTRADHVNHSIVKLQDDISKRNRGEMPVLKTPLTNLNGLQKVQQRDPIFDPHNDFTTDMLMADIWGDYTVRPGELIFQGAEFEQDKKFAQNEDEGSSSGSDSYSESDYISDDESGSESNAEEFK